MRRLFLALFLALVACSSDKSSSGNNPADCPSDVIDSRLWQRTFGSLLDSANQHKFESCGESWNKNGKTVVANFTHEGVHYRVRWTQANGGEVQFWERRTSPFGIQIGSDPQTYESTYADVGYTGCVNFGIGQTADPGKMQWNNGHDWQVHYHGDWQARYNKAVNALAATLGVK
jgi:uncharacterized protein YcfL